MTDKFEKQLKQMKTELKQLQTAKREHAKALQKNVRLVFLSGVHVYLSV